MNLHIIYGEKTTAWNYDTNLKANKWNRDSKHGGGTRCRLLKGNKEKMGETK